jgi:hypothetical protein
MSELERDVLAQTSSNVDLSVEVDGVLVKLSVTGSSEIGRQGTEPKLRTTHYGCL